MCFLLSAEILCLQEAFPADVGSWRGLAHVGKEMEDQRGGPLSDAHENRQQMSIL